MKKIKILDLIPVIETEGIEEGIKDREKLGEYLKEETGGLIELEVLSIDKGTASIEGNYDEALNVPYILEKVRWAERSGYDAVVLDCFGDPGLDAARELVEIPVIGANQAAIHMASQLSTRFSIINILPETEYLIRALVMKYGLIQNLASIRTINIPVLTLEKNPEITTKKVVEAAEKAVFEDGAYSVILGCTGMSPLVDAVREHFVKIGLNVPIIEPLRAAVYTAVATVLAGLSHSKRAYMTPREKFRKVDL